MRALIVPELRRRWPAARIIHEMPNWYSSNRIDLAAVTPQDIIGVEIKSSRDVIHRLEAQLRAFYPITTRLIVALAPKWNEELPRRRWTNKHGQECAAPVYTEAQQIIRDVGRIDIWTCDAATGLLDTGDTIREMRRPLHPVFDLGPRHRPWAEWLLHVLHVAELKEVAARHCIAVGKRPNHDQLVAACCDTLRGPEILRAVCRALRARDAFCDGTDAPIVEEGGAA